MSSFTPQPLYAGDTYTKTVRLRSADTNLPISILGYTFYYTLKQHKDDTDAQALLTQDVTVTTEDVTGEMTFTFTHDDTKDLPVCNAYAEVKFKDASGIVRTVEQTRKQIKDSYRDSLE